MGVCHAWYQAAVANYQRRWRQVAAIAGELSRMVGAASPGDTILLEGGVHAVHSTITIDVPLRCARARGRGRVRGGRAWVCAGRFRARTRGRG